MKKKTFVLMISKNFPAKHIRAGQPTDFKRKILSGEKIHTLRGNAELWEKRAERINKGEAVLSIREWEGKPYRSKQVEIATLDKIGIQRVLLYPVFVFDGYNAIVAGNPLSKRDRLAVNDGLLCEDFKSWFPKRFEGCIIHFTDFRY